ncbi:MAG: DUF2239 family protein [Burkholderiaceae bacterium]
MGNAATSNWSAFKGHELLSSGPALAVAMAVKQAYAEDDPLPAILVFDDASGRVIDLDLRGDADEIAQRLAGSPSVSPGRARTPPGPAPAGASERKGRGRPRLGVISREVTLLPRHWDWLASQRGGASAALRRLVDEARKHPDNAAIQRRAREAAYVFMQAIAGDFPAFEEASRALFAGDRPKLEQLIEHWPTDIRDYALRLAFESPTASADQEMAGR